MVLHTHLIKHFFFVLLNLEGVVEDVTMAPGRACQLGRRAEGASVPQRVSMSELMQWKHFSGTVASYGDVYLDHARSHITYAFQNTTSKTQEMA